MLKFVLTIFPSAELLISVLNGTGIIETEEGQFSFKKGAHFIIPATIKSFLIKGEASLIVSHT
ncbi:hypothetical protein [Metabacillus idriensis]|uniref:hypothetical protein n=1 Tax=Metabacillus idriensis TaxID=324768 RepID=UPI003D2E6E29